MNAQTQGAKTEIRLNENAHRGKSILAKMRDLAESDKVIDSKAVGMSHPNCCWANHSDNG